MRRREGEGLKARPARREQVCEFAVIGMSASPPLLDPDS